MTLSDLVGEHMLSGVDFTTTNVKRYGYVEDECQNIRFRLDGVTYVATEDPVDGYRSGMAELTTIAEPTTNEWPPVRVVASMRGTVDGEEHDVLEIRDVMTGREVVCVGTGNTDDYYPYWVAVFDPTALAHNAP
jgi:hypothetical protein